MNINLILSALKLREKDLPNVRDIHINAEILDVLGKINETGQQSVLSVTIDQPNATADPPEVEGNPADRLITTPYNYYPTLKCLIIPTNVVSINTIYFGSIPIIQCTQEQWLSGNMPYMSYYPTQTGELYFSFDLVAGDIIKLSGRMGFTSIDMLPDYYYNYVLCHVLAGLYFNIERNADLYAIESRKLDGLWRVILNKSSQISYNIPKSSLFKR